MTTATVALETSQRRRRGQIYVALAAIAWSTAGVLQRQLTLDTSTQVLGRATFAAGALLAYVALVEHGRVAQAFRSIGAAGVAVALSVATAAGSFIAALNHTSVARVLFIQAISPVLASLLAWIALKEPIDRRTAIALATAIAGVALMLGAPGGGNLEGDVLALIMATAFAVALVISRHRNARSPDGPECLQRAATVDHGDIGQQRGTREHRSAENLGRRVDADLALEDARRRPGDCGERHVDLSAPSAPRPLERHRRRRHAVK